MKILADCDAMPRPLKEVLLKVAEREKVETLFVAAQCLRLPESAYVRAIGAGGAFNGADDWIVEHIDRGDLVVTADIPLADRALGVGAEVLGIRGDFFTPGNIKNAMAMRELMEELRSTGEAGGGPPPFSERQRVAFMDALNRFLQKKGGVVKKTLGIGAIALGVLLGGCSSGPEKTVFVPDDGRLAHDSRIPAGRVWKDPSAAMSKYDKILIADVRTDLRLEQSWAEHNGVRALMGKEDADLKELAAYMKETFSKAVRTGPCRMTLVDKPAPGTVRLELAIVKVVANKPLIETGTTAAAAVLRPITLCLIPVKSVLAHETDSPLSAYIAIEGKVVDAETGKVLVLFAANSHEKGAILDVNKLVSPYANVREIIDRWGKQLVEVINKRPLETGAKMENGQPGKHDYSLIHL